MIPDDLHDPARQLAHENNQSMRDGLEDRFGEIWLVDAHHVKNVPGRKTDMSDAEWLADVAAHGMVRPSLVPSPEIRGLRELTRYRKTQITARGHEIQRLEKLLQDAGIKLTSVASTVWSKSSRAMVEMLISGQRDPTVLAELAKGPMRCKIPAIIEALESRWVSHHGAVARRIIAHIDFLDATIDALSTEIVERLDPVAAAVSLLTTIPGVSELTAQIIVAETGADMSKFPTRSWPGSRSSVLGSSARPTPVSSSPRTRALPPPTSSPATASTRRSSASPSSLSTALPANWERLASDWCWCRSTRTVLSTT